MSAATSVSSHGLSAQAPVQTPHQDRLNSLCRSQGVRTPNFQIISDRRGGRTAWSCVVTVQGNQYPARFWYDGQYVNNAREDAAEKALQMLGILPAPPGPQIAHHRPQYTQQSQFYGAING